MAIKELTVRDYEVYYLMSGLDLDDYREEDYYILFRSGIYQKLDYMVAHNIVNVLGHQRNTYRESVIFKDLEDEKGLEIGKRVEIGTPFEMRYAQGNKRLMHSNKVSFYHEDKQSYIELFDWYLKRLYSEYKKLWCKVNETYDSKEGEVLVATVYPKYWYEVTSYSNHKIMDFYIGKDEADKLTDRYGKPFLKWLATKDYEKMMGDDITDQELLEKIKKRDEEYIELCRDKALELIEKRGNA